MKYVFPACIVLFLCRVLCAAEEQWVDASLGMDVPIRAWHAEGTGAGAEVLVLIPGYNGDGAAMLDARWKAFAETHQLILLAPTFRAEGNENNQGKGYYYPEQGSGVVIEKALRELGRRSGANPEKVLLFGFSAGAHVTHRFALWKPERVKAFVAYSAGWWSEPTRRLKAVPALILCGEKDPRYGATYGFFRKGHRLGCPWLWRSYRDTGHVLTPGIRDLAEAFLAHHAGAQIQDVKDLRYGDYQTFQSVMPDQKQTIAEEFRIVLPNRQIAEIWERE